MYFLLSLNDELFEGEDCVSCIFVFLNFDRDDNYLIISEAGKDGWMDE